MKNKIPKSAVFCPRCKSTHVEKELTASAAFGAPQEWVCNNCGFRGHIFPKIEKLKNQAKKF